MERAPHRGGNRPPLETDPFFRFLDAARHWMDPHPHQRQKENVFMDQQPAKKRRGPKSKFGKILVNLIVTVMGDDAVENVMSVFTA